MIFGWRTRRKHWDIGNGYTLRCSFKYFHIWYIIRLITDVNWWIIGPDGKIRMVSKSQLDELLPSGAPNISAYNR